MCCAWRKSNCPGRAPRVARPGPCRRGEPGRLEDARGQVWAPCPALDSGPGFLGCRRGPRALRQEELFRAGEEVFGCASEKSGSYAEYALAPTAQVAEKRQDLGHIQAAGAAHRGPDGLASPLRAGHLQPGQRVLIHAAAGGRRHFALQFAKWKGAYVLGRPPPPNMRTCCASWAPTRSSITAPSGSRRSSAMWTWSWTPWAGRRRNAPGSTAARRHPGLPGPSPFPASRYCPRVPGEC